jgi:glycosyltransferase involved in cell wall biosynthesis
LVLFGNVPLLGNERANIETLDQLQQQGAQVKFLIRREWTYDTIQKELNRRHLAFEFVPFFDTIMYGHGVRVWLKNVLGIVGGSWALFRQILSFRPTHLHVGSTAWVLNFCPIVLFSRIPLVFRAGELPATHHPLWKWIWRLTCSRSSVFVCDSQYLKREIVRLGAPESRCEVVYAPAPRQREAKRAASPRSLESPLVILYVGQISAQKGVHLLVQAAERLIQEYPVRFIIAGDFSWRNPFGQELSSRVHESGLDKRVSFLGFVEDIEPLYQKAHLHVAPSVSHESYGLTVVEAKAHAIPSIVFPTGGLVELVEHQRDGWVCEASTAKCLENAIVRYLREPSLLQVEGEAAFASLTERLQVDEYGRRWARIYTGSLNDRVSG